MGILHQVEEICICAPCDMYQVKCTQYKQKIRNISKQGKSLCVIHVQFIEIAAFEQTNGIEKHLIKEPRPLMLSM